MSSQPYALRLGVMISCSEPAPLSKRPYGRICKQTGHVAIMHLANPALRFLKKPRGWVIRKERRGWSLALRIPQWNPRDVAQEPRAANPAVGSEGRSSGLALRILKESEGRSQGLALRIPMESEGRSRKGNLALRIPTESEGRSSEPHAANS